MLKGRKTRGLSCACGRACSGAVFLEIAELIQETTRARLIAFMTGESAHHGLTSLDRGIELLVLRIIMQSCQNPTNHEGRWGS